MVKHVALIIGCVILSFSAALIVPTSCSPIGENEQKETNLAETRSKRQAPVKTSAASSSSAQSEILTTLFPILTGFKPSPIFGLGGLGGLSGLSGGSNGLAGVLKGLSPQLLAILNPITKTLGYTVGGLGGTLDNTLDGLGNKLGFLNQPLDDLGNVIQRLLGSTSPKYGAGTPRLSGPYAILNEQVTSAQAKASASTNG